MLKILLNIKKKEEYVRKIEEKKIQYLELEKIYLMLFLKH